MERESKERPVYHIFPFLTFFFNDLKTNTLTLDIEMYSNLDEKVSKTILTLQLL